MPGNIVRINNRDEMEWYVGDSRMNEVINMLNRVGLKTSSDVYKDLGLASEIPIQRVKIGLDTKGIAEKLGADIVRPMKGFSRKELQGIRDKAMRMLDMPTSHCWNAAYDDLVNAADRLDAMFARTEVKE